MSIPSESKVAWDGPIIFIGFGSISRALFPLLHRHLNLVSNLITIIDPDDTNKHVADSFGATFLQLPLTKKNHQEVLKRIVEENTHQTLIINISVNVSSKDIIKVAHELGALYVDATIDPWPGTYFNNDVSNEEKSNYALRESLLELKEICKGGPTAVSCCGANPGMVSWLVKQALMNLAKDINFETQTPTSQFEWAKIMMDLGVKGIHIAERDSQVPKTPKKKDEFVNTWSVDGFLAEVLQPAELGWGTHEKIFPIDGHEHKTGSKSAIYLDTFGGKVRVRTWTPTFGPDFAFLITHNEAISLSDYFTLKKDGRVIFRPTCHYAYRPSDVAVESLEELFANNCQLPHDKHVLTEDEIHDGMDELGVLLYGHEKNAYWYGSQLSVEEARSLAPYQNATSLQVSSAVLAGIVWAIQNPNRGLVEVEELDYEKCLDIQKPYLGKLAGYYTDWKPISQSEQDTPSDAWQFTNIRY